MIIVDGEAKFRSLIPILKDPDLVSCFYDLKNQISLEEFLSNKNIRLSIEEIESLWDIIEACKSPYIKNGWEKIRGIRNSDAKQYSKKDELSDSNLDVSGGVASFYEKMVKAADFLNGN